MKVTVEYYPGTWRTKINGYWFEVKSTKTDFDLEKVNLYNYETSDTAVTERYEISEFKKVVDFFLAPIKERFIQLPVNKCMVDFGDMPQEDIWEAQSIISRSEKIHPRGKKKTGLALWAGKEPRNRVKDQRLKVEIISTEESDGKEEYFYCNHQVMIPSIITTKEVHLDNLFIGSFTTKELDKSVLPRRPIPMYGYMPASPSWRPDEEFKKARLQYRLSGYPRGIAKRMALEETKFQYKKEAFEMREKKAKARDEHEQALRVFEDELKELH